MLTPLLLRPALSGWALYFMSNRIPYSKPHLSYQDQLSKLKSRGLTVNDEPKALHLLEHLSYYRLSGYWFPFLSDKVKHQFKAGSTFEDSFSLYCFDNELKQIISNELGKIEIAIRAKLVHTNSLYYHSFWFADSSLFTNNSIFSITLSKLEKELDRSHEVFINSFFIKYSDKYPPSWITLEVVSMGTLSILYKNLKPSKAKKEIADHFGLSPKILISWLHVLVYVRNLCAHHSRVWNRELRIRPKNLKRPRRNWIGKTSISNKKIYVVLCIIRYITTVIHPNSQLNDKISKTTI